ncbi:MAG: hypothetical protein PHY16_05710 [Methylobacter sp.]|nr:hypothetical protein [Methylobacter sp.]
MTLFDRIKVNIIDMAFEAVVIADKMLLKPALPNTPLTFGLPAG